MTVSLWLLLLGIVIVATAFGYVGRNWERQPRRMWWIIWGTTILAAIAYSSIAVWRHAHFETHAFDLGIFDQAIWNLSRFHEPASTIRGISNLFGDHFHPIIAVLAPFYWLYSSPNVLLVAQAILLSLTIPLVYLLGRQLKIPPLASFLISLSVGLNPGYLLAVNFDFHEIAFAPVFFFLAAWSAFAHRWKWYWVGILGLVVSKESMWVYAAMLGVTLILRSIRGNWKSTMVKHGALTVVVCLAGFFLVTRLIIPSLSGGQGYGYWQQYAAVGATPIKLAENLVVHPRHTLSVLIDNPDKRRTARYMLGSFIGIPLVAWSVWPLTLMTLGERFWTTNYGLWLFQFHYQVMMVTVYGFATLTFLADLGRWRRLRGVALGIAVTTVCITAMFLVHVWPTQKVVTSEIRNRPIQVWNAALRLIPATARVSAQDAFVPHLTHRDLIDLYPNVHNADWIILDPRAPSWPLTTDEVISHQAALAVDPTWVLRYRAGTLTMYQRQSAVGKVQ